MELQQFAEYISIEVPTAWEHCCEAAMERYRPNWLDDYDFEYILDYYEFSKEYYKPRLRQEVALLKQDTVLNRICWLMHYVLFYGDKDDYRNIWGWGKGSKPFARHGSLATCVVAALTGQPIHEKNMALRGYDEDQIQIHKNGVRDCWVEQHENYGLDGISFELMIWSTMFMHCYLVRLGRLQYECGLKHYDKYDSLFEGESVYINVHIPAADNGLRADEVDESIRLAEEKLEQYFPRVVGKNHVYCTNSWLLSPQLREILKPGSNIVKFQNRFTVTNLIDDPAPFLKFVFQVESAGGSIDYRTLPEDTHLRREIKARLLRGDTLQVGFGYFTL